MQILTLHCVTVSVSGTCGWKWLSNNF